jgi:hypothetical protein
LYAGSILDACHLLCGDEQPTPPKWNAPAAFDRSNFGAQNKIHSETEPPRSCVIGLQTIRGCNVRDAVQPAWDCPKQKDGYRQ